MFAFSNKGRFRTLHSFCQACSDGVVPEDGVILDKSGNLYGTTFGGGSEGCGTIFEILHNGGEAILHSFCTGESDEDGSNPVSALTMDAKGNLYGTTKQGGSENKGTVFKLTP